MTTTDTAKQKAPAGSTGAISEKASAAISWPNYTTFSGDPLVWFAEQGAKFVKVVAWNARVTSPGKQPLGKDWQKKPFSLEEIQPHIEAGGNVGLLCGADSSNLGLLDIDGDYARFCAEIPGLAKAPSIIREGADRAKVIIRIKGEMPAGRKWKDNPERLTEWLSTGNQGVIPPSIHPEGSKYCLINADQPIPVFDGWRIKAIAEAWTGQEDKPTKATAGPVMAVGSRGKLRRATVDFIATGAPAHTRNDGLYNAACDLAGCSYTQSEAEQMLLPTWLRMGKEEPECLATIKSAYARPRTPARPDAFTSFPLGNVPAESDATEEQPVEIKTISAPVTVHVEAAEEEPTFALSAYTPELPRAARLTEAEQTAAAGAGTWLDEYTKYANQASPMTPALFHLSYGLSLLSTAIARRVYVRAGDDVIYPNLYMLLIAPSTLYAKTTGLNVALKLLDVAGLNNFLLPTGVTPQSLISELTHRVPPTFNDWVKDDRDEWQKERLFAAQRAWWMDEAASLLDLFKQKNTADLLGLILKLYGCPPRLTASTVGRGRETVRYPYLSICGPTTPAAMRSHLKNYELWGDGLFARFLMVTPDTAPVDAFYQATLETPSHLAQHLNKLAFQTLQTPKENITGVIQAPPAIQAQIQPEVWRKWQAYKSGIFTMLVNKAVPEKLYSLYGRLHTTAIKIAMLLAASDVVDMAEGNPLVIRPEHWARAQMLTEGYRASLHRLVDDASKPVDDEDQELAEKIISRVTSTDKNTRRELAQSLHMSAGAQRARFDALLNQLLHDGILEERETKPGRGPTTTRIYIRIKNP
jgi:hypothetical protein